VNAGRTITIQVNGTLAQTVIPGQIIPNSAEVRWTSMDGNPGQRSQFTPNSTERTGAGGVNDYLAVDGADITVLNVNLTKTVDSTSEDATDDSAAVVVGEIVRYRIQVAIPDFDVATGFRFVDLLPAGMELIDDDNSRVALVSDAGDNLVSSTLTDPSPAAPHLYLTGDESNVTTLEPQFPIPLSILSFATVNGRTQITFDLGQVTNPAAPGDDDFEYLLVEFNAVVNNVLANQVGTTFVNEVTVFENGVQTGPVVTSPTLRVAEPAITGVDKAVVTLADLNLPEARQYDAGDRVRYTVRYANGVGADVSTAYDAQLIDALPSAKMMLDPASIAVFRNGVLITSGFTITPHAPDSDTVDVTVAEVAPGDAITITYEVTLKTAVEAGEIIPNTANVTWTSLPGDGTPRDTPANPTFNKTGSVTPGASGTGTGERNGTDGPGGLNDYAASDAAIIEIIAPQLDKAIVFTDHPSTTANQFDPNLTDLHIGEVVAYQITITLPEGTTNLVFTDELPFGPDGVVGFFDLAFIPGTEDSFPVDPSQVSGQVLGRDGDGVLDGVTIDSGTLVNPPDGVLTNRDRLIFGVLGQVLDEPANVADKDVTNTATIDWGNGTLSDSVTAEVVEPVLDVTKEVVGSTQVDAGDIVTYRVTVRHDPTSSAFAADVILTDMLPAGLELIPTSPQLIYAPDYSSVQIIPLVSLDPNVPPVTFPPPTFQVNGNTLTFSADFLDHPDSTLVPNMVDEFIFEYQARVTPTALPGQPVTNTQTMTYSSASDYSEIIYSNFARDYQDSDPAEVTVFSNSIAGLVYRDLNNNGVYEPASGETLITDSTTFELTGTEAFSGATVTRTVTTTTGSYLFDLLRPGTYSVRQVNQPTGLLDARNPRDAETISNIVIGRGDNKTGINYNFGELLPATVGDFVFEDTNGNGRRDSGEPGVNAVNMTLTGTDDTGRAVTRTTQTNSSGLYTIDNLRPGTYQITFTAPSGYVFTVQDSAVADDTTDSDAAVSTGQTAAFTIAAGQTDTTRDAGLYRPASVGDFVWYDVNPDGIQDSGEPGIPGVRVVLDYAGIDGMFGTADDVLGTANQLTTANGAYQFANLRPGTYRVRINPLTLPNGLTVPTFDFDGVGTEHQAVLALASNETNTAVDFGYAPQTPDVIDAQVGNRVWNDVNEDGSDTGEPGIANVTLTATWFGFDGIEGTTDDLDFTDITDSAGFYGFTQIPLGGYRVTVNPATLPPDRLPTYDLDGGTTNPNGNTLVTLTAAQPIELGADFGYTGQAGFGDRVWLDFDGDGAQDVGEPGRAGVTVTATWAGPDDDLAMTDDNVILTAVTGINGGYGFADLPLGLWQVVVTSGLPAAVTNTGDPDGTFDSQTSFMLGVNQVLLDKDFGYQGNNSLAGFVYRDFDVDGLREPSGANPETGIAGVGITLRGTDTGGRRFTRTTMTATDGSYFFDGLPDGVYRVIESQPPSVFVAGRAGFYDGLDTVGSPGGSSPAKNQLAVTFTADIDAVEYNFGENPPADPFGFAYMDLNNNGIREPGERGIAGVRVRVSGTAFPGTPLERPLNAADIPGGSLVAITAANGRWEFPVLPPGLYSFVETQPAGFLDGLEQDADPNGPPTTVGNDRFDNVQLFPFPVRGPFNFGEIAGRGSISGFVYVDRNSNGFRDAGEVGIPGVTVQLFGIDLAGRSATATVVTDGNGYYSFRRMTPGAYRIIEQQPAAYLDGIDRAGDAGGIARNDDIGRIILGPNQAASNYLFGERGLRSGIITKRGFLTTSGILIPLPPAGSGIAFVTYVSG
jgi:fimbrial isopeptide formation D2 family protein